MVLRKILSKIVLKCIYFSCGFFYGEWEKELGVFIRVVSIEVFGSNVWYLKVRLGSKFG